MSSWSDGAATAPWGERGPALHSTVWGPRPGIPAGRGVSRGSQVWSSGGHLQLQASEGPAAALRPETAVVTGREHSQGGGTGTGREDRQVSVES